MNDITYGKIAEIWPRDYSMLSRRIQFLRFNQVPMKFVSGNGVSVVGRIAKFYPFKKEIAFSFCDNDKKRWPIMIENIALLEENVEITSLNDSGYLHIERFNDLVYEPSRKDFFGICNKCFKQGVGIRVHLHNGYICEGETTGVNECHVGILNKNGHHVQILFDWVYRITSIDFYVKSEDKLSFLEIVSC